MIFCGDSIRGQKYNEKSVSLPRTPRVFHMKRAVTIPLLLLANIFILAHAVVPHHHHDRTTVVVHLFEHDGDEHRSCGENLPAGHDDGREECFLYKAYASKEIKRGHGELCLCCHPVEIVLPAGCSLPEIQASGLPALRPEPPVLTYHYQYLTRSLGLRAPPVC